MSSDRAFSAWAFRLAGVGKPVYSRDDIIRAMRDCMAQKRPCRICLGADVVLTAGIIVPASLPAFIIEGGGKYKLIVSGALTSLFTCAASPTIFCDLDIVFAAGASAATSFIVQGSPTVLDNVSVDATLGTLTDVFSTGGAATRSKLIVDTASFIAAANLFADDGASAEWNLCHLCDITFNGGGAATITVGRGASGPRFFSCTFERLDGPGVIDLHGADCLFIEIGGCTSVATNVLGGQGHVFIGAGQPAGGVTLGGVDTWIGGALNTFMGKVAVGRQTASASLDVDGGFVLRPAAATLNSAGPTLTPADRSFIRVTHGASASGNVTIAAGTDGQRLILYFVSVAGTAAYTDGSGNLELSANLTPTAADTLELIYDATTAKWVELGRSVN